MDVVSILLGIVLGFLGAVALAWLTRPKHVCVYHEPHVEYWEHGANRPFTKVTYVCKQNSLHTLIREHEGNIPKAMFKKPTVIPGAFEKAWESKKGDT
ncbi:MAG: hypothetical protein Q8R28_15260 [Dehalococcoidia bacterium]|nr:hypothetical protein [Dehalococcoidia bacterium]